MEDKKKNKKYKPRKDEVTTLKYLVTIKTMAHRPDQLERTSKILAREMYHAFGSELAKVEQLVNLPNNSQGNPVMVEIIHDPLDKAL